MDTNIVNTRSVSVWWCLYVLSNIWTTFAAHENIKQHWGWIEALLIKKSCTVFARKINVRSSYYVNCFIWKKELLKSEWYNIISLINLPAFIQLLTQLPLFSSTTLSWKNFLFKFRTSGGSKLRKFLLASSLKFWNL